MDAKLDALLASFSQAEHEPINIVSFLQRLPDPGTLPSPWETWALIGLLRHRDRQLWVAEIIRNRLQGALSDLAKLGAFGHPEGVPQSGNVPNMPEWEYYFHGRGCCISHKVLGDAIDVDFYDDSAEYFDTFLHESRMRAGAENPSHSGLASKNWRRISSALIGITRTLLWMKSGRAPEIPA